MESLYAKLCQDGDTLGTLTITVDSSRKSAGTTANVTMTLATSMGDKTIYGRSRHMVQYCPLTQAVAVQTELVGEPMLMIALR